ncbi:uncharacterized protein LOC129601348 [Paramacrobiotus metropolitanus]|uniref:uncharacterized protein LOC129601348 n=1 Tax=Paramacrobiotus metropolitanus TaxID=2943436 RepID=UPI0024459A95|nr:uncharacterized protein LOC129601348 [Paramacrobiotus metropolitanus]
MLGFVLGGLMCWMILPQNVLSLESDSSSANVALSSAYLSIPYRNFQARIYKESNGSPNVTYYYAPACTFVPNSTYVVYNNHQNYLVFALQLWEASYRDYIQTELKQMDLLSNSLNLRTIPFHSMRMELIDSTLPVKVMNQWIPIPHQPTTVLGRIICSAEKECSDIKTAVENPQDQLLFGLEVSFALTKPGRMKREVALNTTAFEASEIFSFVPETPTMCMQQTDLRRLLRETLDHLLEGAIPDDEFVGESQLFTAVNRFQRIVKPSVITTTDFTEEQWKNVLAYRRDPSRREDQEPKRANGQRK